jgi:hypothetical protein
VAQLRTERVSNWITTAGSLVVGSVSDPIASAVFRFTSDASAAIVARP